MTKTWEVWEVQTRRNQGWGSKRRYPTEQDALDELNRRVSFMARVRNSTERHRVLRIEETVIEEISAPQAADGYQLKADG